MFKKVTPNLMVESVNDTLEFYRDALGFEVLATVPDEGTFDWAMAGREDVVFMFQTRASLGGEIPVFNSLPLGGSLTLYTEVTDVDEVHERIRGRTEIVHDLTTTFYGTREFAFKDCNGYIVALAQTIHEPEQSEE